MILGESWLSWSGDNVIAGDQLFSTDLLSDAAQFDDLEEGLWHTSATVVVLTYQ